MPIWFIFNPFYLPGLQVDKIGMLLINKESYSKMIQQNADYTLYKVQLGFERNITLRYDKGIIRVSYG